MRAIIGLLLWLATFGAGPLSIDYLIDRILARRQNLRSKTPGTMQRTAGISA